MRVMVAEFAIEVGLTPLVHINGEHFGIDEGATEGLVGWRIRDNLSEVTVQLAPDKLRDFRGAGGIDVGKKNEVPVEHLPVRRGELAKAGPIEVAGALP